MSEEKEVMPYSPAEALRTNSWRLRMAYSPDYIKKHHQVWHEEMVKKQEENQEQQTENYVFPHVAINELAAD